MARGLALSVRRAGLGSKCLHVSPVCEGRAVCTECIFRDHTLRREGAEQTRLQCVNAAVEPSWVLPRNSESVTNPVCVKAEVWGSDRRSSPCGGVGGDGLSAPVVLFVSCWWVFCGF